ncbi:MAG: 4-alpha-glucanotransferase [Candidatus Omnitrophota bacterium]|nr:4-alpha-glucanotransferase [Candidatus Omnitrophota bacterium]
MKSNGSYEQFTEKVTQKQWDRIGLGRRAGVAVPLFSLYSRRSVGIGEIPDLKILVDWCVKTQMSILQLLPMNDVGFNFLPYDSQSTFALEPMYLSLEEIRGVKAAAYKEDLGRLHREFPTGQERINYGIKAAKLELLLRMYHACAANLPKAFEEFVETTRFWLDDYAAYKVAKEVFKNAGWHDWPEALRNCDSKAVEDLRLENAEAVRYQKWLQWQLYEQFKDLRSYAAREGVFFMGDMPFLVSGDSADVWANQAYFNLDAASGAPPDDSFAGGQRWGMPPYNWQRVAEHDYDYLREKLRYAEHFYDMFRIDHAVGVFRLWTIPGAEPIETAGINGNFEPADESQWEDHGRKLLSFMIEHSKMLPCAEDLGTVPECSYRVLEEYGIPGIDVQRWLRKWGESYDFKDPAEYRKNSIVAISTHDMSPLAAWWRYEAGTVDRMIFERACGRCGIAFEDVLSDLFDTESSHYGRLRWKPEMDHEDKLLQCVGSSKEGAGIVLDLYRGSFDEKQKFLHYIGLNDENEDGWSNELARAALKRASEAASVFCIQLLQDWLVLDNVFEGDPWKWRVNIPATLGPDNWSIVMPFALDDLAGFKATREIRRIHEETDRH